jgi:putative intracellular protease/amidase
MSRYRLMAVLAVLASLVAGCALGTQPTATPVSKGKVLLIANERSQDMGFMLTNEVGVMMSMLKDAGYKVVVASESGGLLAGGTMTTTLQPDLKLADVRVDDYVGFLLACVASTTSVPPAQAVEIAKEAMASEKPVAAQAGGIYTLSAAGALKGKKFAFGQASNMGEGLYQGDGVVQDGNIITSGICPMLARQLNRPDGTRELTQKLIDALASK